MASIFVAVREAMLQAARRARSGQGPSLLQADCYRWRPHNFGDAHHHLYRTKQEIEDASKRDPVALFRLQAIEVCGSEEVAAVELAVTSEFDLAVRFASDSNPAESERVFDFVPAPCALFMLTGLLRT